MKYLIIFLVWFISVVVFAAGTIWYVSNRYALFFPAIPKKAWIWGFIALFVLFILCLTVFSMTAHPIGKPIYIFGGVATALFLFLIMSVAVTDLINLVFKFTPQIRGFLTTGLAVLLTVYGVWNAHTIKVREIIIPLQGLTQEIRAVHITDVHLGNLWGKRQMDKIVRKIKELNPDVIFNTGDMFDSKAYFEKGKDVLAAFRTLNVPHYFVYGNHDEMVGISEVIAQLKNANATVLQNEIAQFGELQIIGFDNMLADENTIDPHTKPGAENIKSVMARLPIDENRPTVVLHHRPDGVKYMQEKGVDLLLAGHTHAGQIFPFSLLAKLMFGYNSGLYQYETMSIYVSEGTGSIFLPVRFGTRNEIALVRLVNAIEN